MSKKYLVNELAEISGVTVRTLHHYDEIGLLIPSERSDKGHRFYSKRELLRLQQILFYKELDMSLQEIREVLDAPDFDLVEALKDHKKKLEKRAEQMQKLLVTLEKTINKLNQNKMMTDKELYEGFSPEEAKNNRREAVERWGEEKIKKSEDKLRALGKEKFKAIKMEGENLVKNLAGLMDREPGDTEVQAVVAAYHRHLNQFHEIDKEMYRALGKMYVEDERFKANYEKVKSGLAEFLHQAIEIYCS